MSYGDYSPKDLDVKGTYGHHGSYQVEGGKVTKGKGSEERTSTDAQAKNASQIGKHLLVPESKPSRKETIISTVSSKFSKITDNPVADFIKTIIDRIKEVSQKQKTKETSSKVTPEIKEDSVTEILAWGKRNIDTQKQIMKVRKAIDKFQTGNMTEKDFREKVSRYEGILHFPDEKGVTQLQHAARLGNYRAVEIIFEKAGLDPFVLDKEGKNILHHAYEGGNQDIIDYFESVEPGLIQKQDNSGKVPSDYKKS